MSYFINDFYKDAFISLDSFTTWSITLPERRRRIKLVLDKLEKDEWLMSVIRTQMAFDKALGMPLTEYSIDPDKKEAYFGY